MTGNELKAIMANCYGTEQYYRNPFMKFLFTDGVKTFAENAGAIWLLQEINGMLVDNKIMQSPDYLTTIKFVVKDDKGDILLKNNKKTFKKHISYTDCPEGEWEFYYDKDANVLMWCGEY